VIVQIVTPKPPRTVLGVNLINATPTWVTVKVAVSAWLAEPPVTFAVIPTWMVDDSTEVKMLNVPCVAPPAIEAVPVTPGVVKYASFGWSLVRVKFNPLAGAGDVNVILPVAVPFGPPTTDCGDMVRRNETPSTVSVAGIETPPRLAVMVDVCVEPETPVVIVNVALVAPDGTVTLVGTCATAVLLLESLITTPPSGAALLIITVPVDVAPPATSVGLIVNWLKF